MTTVQELFDLTGRVAVVTGGAGLLAFQMASALATFRRKMRAFEQRGISGLWIGGARVFVSRTCFAVTKQGSLIPLCTRHHQRLANVDQVVGEDAEPYPTFHSLNSAIETAP
jgi:hypothetical protein